MPLVKSEIPQKGVIWGLWQITETEEELRNYTTLSDEDYLYLDSISHPEKRLQTLSARALLKQLCMIYNIPYQGVMKDASSGKPYLVNSDWHISFSHCRSMSSAILHSLTPVGIDVECLQEKMKSVQHKYLDEDEIAWANGDIKKLGVLWSAKEAIYKLLNKKGLSLKHIKMVSSEENPLNGEFHLTCKTTLGNEIKESSVNSKQLRNHIMSYCC